jgi:hypothetical protein
MTNYEFGKFLKNRVFHKNPNTPPFDEISEFRKNIILLEIKKNSTDIGNKLLYLLGAHVKPPKLAKSET